MQRDQLCRIIHNHGIARRLKFLEQTIPQMIFVRGASWTVRDRISRVAAIAERAIPRYANRVVHAPGNTRPSVNGVGYSLSLGIVVNKLITLAESVSSNRQRFNKTWFIYLPWLAIPADNQSANRRISPSVVRASPMRASNAPCGDGCVVPISKTPRNFSANAIVLLVQPDSHVAVPRSRDVVLFAIA